MGQLLDPGTDKVAPACAFSLVVRPCGRFLVCWRVPSLDSVQRRLSCLTLSDSDPLPTFSLALRPFPDAVEGTLSAVLTAHSASGDYMHLCESYPVLMPAAPVLFSLLAVQATVDLCVVAPRPKTGRPLTPSGGPPPASDIWKVVASVRDETGPFAACRRALETSIWSRTS